MSVQFEAVTYCYPGTASGVEGIDFELKKGELLALIGPSGSGKSTVLKLLAGFLQPDSGRILVDGNDVSGLAPRERNLGVVFQSYALFAHMSVQQNVAYPLKVRRIPSRERERRARQAIANVGLANFADRRPTMLSGGQQQRVALARALVFEPQALLLDEPLSALDAALRGEMRDEIIRVQEQADIATLHVTHDQEEALSIGHRVAVIHSGRILQIDTPRRLYDAPASRTVAAFVGEANLWSGRVRGNGAVECALGTLVCETGDFREGERVNILVRPENIVAHDDDAISVEPNHFSGTLIRDRFLGAMRRYDVRVGETKIRGATSNRGNIHSVSIPPGTIRLLTSGTD